MTMPPDPDDRRDEHRIDPVTDPHNEIADNRVV
jgi:hypothetical protein